MKCLNCNREIRDDAKFCTGCGTRVPRCPTCGTLLQRRARFCVVDGTPIPDEINALIPEPAQVAAVEPAEIPMVEQIENAVAAQIEIAAAEPENTPAVQPAEPAMQEPPVVEKPAAVKKKKKGSGSKVIVTILLVVIALAVLAAAVVIGLKWFAGGDQGDQGDSDGDEIYESGEPLETDPEQDTQEETEEETEDATDAPTETDPVEESEPVIMPDCVGAHFSAVSEFFDSLDCELIIEYVPNDDVEEGYILAQNIPVDSVLAPGAKVVLYVSDGPDIAPEGYNQKVVVTATGTSSYGTLTLYNWDDGEWVSIFSCDATVGKNGIGDGYGEGKKKTPQGTFKLGLALSANSISNPDWPFQKVTSDTCVVDDTGSEYYNTIQSISSLPSGVSYDPIGNTLIKGHSNVCIYIEHNGNGRTSENVVPGKGSVITICGRSAAIAPTAGCVDISAANMTKLLSLLMYEMNPHIEIISQ